MALGLIGKKLGMTRVFNEQGTSIPVTVVEAEPNRITAVKTVASDCYTAVQVTIGSRRPNRVTQAMAGVYRKADVPAGRGLWELRGNDEDVSDLKSGDSLTVSQFTIGQKVDVQGHTIGRGFAGVMKRHGFKGGRATHGNSLSHRAPGSIGQNQDPGRVFPGKKMAGHMGNVNRSQQNLEIIQVDEERNLLLIKGAIPGSRGCDVKVQPSVKNRGN